MTTDIAKLEKFTQKELDLITQTVAKDATKEELSLFLYTAGLRGLNPLTRQIHFVKRGGQGTIQTGIDGFRLIAQRTGKYAPGTKPTIFEYDSKGNLLRATVFGIKIMNGQAFEFSATSKFSEYKVDSNALWKKMPETMLEKCAEAKLLRRGFPEELSGLYTNEEMAQADNEIVVHPAEIPQSPQVLGQDGIEGSPEGEGASLETGDNPNPYADYLTKCPLDNEQWEDGQYGKSHKAQTGSWHQLNAIIREETDRLFRIFSSETAFISEARGKGKAWFASDAFKEWLNNYDPDLPTWSKIENSEKIVILWELKRAVDRIPTTNPLVEEAKKMGAVEK